MPTLEQASSQTAPQPRGNPLLDFADLPAYAQVQPEHVKPAITQLIGEARAALAKVTDLVTPATWDAVVDPLNLATERLSRAWGMVGHLNAVADTPALREAFNALLPEVTEFWTELGLDAGLYAQYKRLSESAEFTRLSATRQRIIRHALRDFRLSGAELQGEARRRYAQIQERSAELAQTFSEHLLDATNAAKLEASAAEVDGIPADVLQVAQEAAAELGKPGYVFTLHQPSYVPVMQYAKSRALRERIYRAYVTRASDLGDAALDNSAPMAELLQLRDEEARLLGFSSFAELSLEPKMADSPAQVEHFLLDLAQRARPYAERDLADLRAFAAENLGLPELASWDISFASERLRERRYDYSEQEVKQYFTEPQVLTGLFALVQTLFGVRIVEAQTQRGAWHPEVKLWDVQTPQGQGIGQFYTDLHARAGKRSGAWMDDARARWLRPGQPGTRLQTPIALLTCNFAAGVGGKPALLTHDDVQTLFHEFGHGLHHLLTQVDDISASGISGVEWDAVELPSQFMENFCWEWDVLQQLTRHVDTGAALPRALFERMLAARNFQAGMQTLRQIEFSLFDLRLHHSLRSFTPQTVADVAAAVRQEVAVLFPPDFYRFQHSFSHIFAGGYAAGYYSYKWAEVLSADAYAQFEENGVLDPQTGARFRDEILARGSSRPALESFRAFRGRDPQIDALLRHQGMVETT
ncbi:Oligopeptidase A [Thiomonas sp. X19]|uniref:M3 family metallopeptidase n=1 Tax=Thiomonas sp. X19 TaxID=1050370 RepID=UPI000B7577AB|nr:M3 family metallopeptidase [Thiomonas sp. X19]SCC92544.1 Oligopeptidase A [Thiomonas sp. X19]